MQFGALVLVRGRAGRARCPPAVTLAPCPTTTQRSFEPLSALVWVVATGVEASASGPAFVERVRTGLDEDHALTALIPPPIGTSHSEPDSEREALATP